MRTLDLITRILLIVGGLNWLFVGALHSDLVAAIFGARDSALARLVYTIVGLCAIWLPAMLDRAPVVTRVDRP
jgi:uncharacterized membrane protein YuzA (DUF378 family)